MKKFLLAGLGLAAISQQALAGNCDHKNYSGLDKTMCKEGLCTIYSATIKLDRNVTYTKVVRNHEVYIDKNLRYIGNYGDDKAEFTTEVIRGPNSCSLFITALQPVFNLISEGFDSMVTDDCRLTEVLNPAQQAVMGLFTTILNKQITLSCDTPEIADK